MNTEKYQNELNNLRELAVEFAEKHPALAPQLSGPSPDPDVERILEGVAFLTGNIRQQLDDDFPEFAQGLMQMIFPHYLRPLPSATIMEFNPKSILKTALNIPKGTMIDSKEVEGASCRFGTCYDVDIAPVTLSNVSVKEEGAGKKAIELNVNLNGIELHDWIDDSLIFYLGGDFVGASELFYLLNHHLSGIDLISNERRVVQLASSSLEAIGFDRDSSMIPFPKNGFPAYRMVQEYFLFKEKFMFLKIKDLKNFETKSHFTLRFNLTEVNIKLPRISDERFVLHATPAINLFEKNAEPIKLDLRHSDIRIKPAQSRSKGVESQDQVYSVDSVIGHNRRAAKETEYHPIGLFRSPFEDEPVSQVTFKTNDESDEVEPYVSIHYPPDYEFQGSETLSIKLTCTNGHLPSQLRPGDISRPTSSTSDLVEFKNISRPTALQQPPMDSGLLWRLLSHLSLNYLSIADAENLKALLNLYIFPNGSSALEESMNRKRVQGIVEVDVVPANRLVKGSLLRGQDIRINLDGSHYASVGDLYLFATLLEQLFNSFASLNCYTATQVTDVHTGVEYSWPARMGGKPLI